MPTTQCVAQAGDSELRIAQIAPLFESVPPKLYGGTERIVSYITEELVTQGHEVTLFASGDSVTTAKLRASCPISLRLDPNSTMELPHHVLMLERLIKDADEFDLIHSHIDYLPFSLFRRSQVPTVTTFHGRLDITDLAPVLQEFSDLPVASISDSQRVPVPWLNWQGTVYHGLPTSLYRFVERPGKYLAFLGRIAPEKRPDVAIEIAKRTGMKLIIAAKVDRVDQRYFDQVIKPLLDHPLIEYIGEIGQAEKEEFLGNAYALLFPIDWPEPFGLVMVESMACGTPIIAFNRGSVPEVIEDGVNGFVVSNIEGAVDAVERISELNRLQCRQMFETRFSAARMVHEYVEIYQRLLHREVSPLTPVGSVA